MHPRSPANTAEPPPVLDYSARRPSAVWPTILAYAVGTLAALSAPFTFVTAIEFASDLSSSPNHAHVLGAGLSFVVWSVFPAWWLARRLRAGRGKHRAFALSRYTRGSRPGA
jgi:hypothetical protein